MIIHKMWEEKTYLAGCLIDIRTKEGWFLLGIFPLYIRTITLKVY